MLCNSSAPWRYAIKNHLPKNYDCYVYDKLQRANESGRVIFLYNEINLFSIFGCCDMGVRVYKFIPLLTNYKYICCSIQGSYIWKRCQKHQTLPMFTRRMHLRLQRAEEILQNGFEHFLTIFPLQFPRKEKKKQKMCKHIEKGFEINALKCCPV